MKRQDAASTLDFRSATAWGAHASPRASSRPSRREEPSGLRRHSEHLSKTAAGRTPATRGDAYAPQTLQKIMGRAGAQSLQLKKSVSHPAPGGHRATSICDNLRLSVDKTFCLSLPLGGMNLWIKLFAGIGNRYWRVETRAL
ncbi:hypothetical protein QQ054_10970 [Oscillatoria amoena NRMC-F 0135]|nr:hypothetical protein [Oscillatoria amoena NRMC-F 0135]